MDAYVFVLERLRENDRQRLNAWRDDGKSRFEVWLVVVVRRLALDFVRQRYGRSRSEDPQQQEESRARRRLEDLVASDVDPDQLEDATRSPDSRVRQAQLIAAVQAALARLSTTDRLLLTLLYVDQRSVREIATTLRLPSVFHVYRRRDALLATLRSDLGRRGIEDAEP